MKEIMRFNERLAFMRIEKNYPPEAMAARLNVPLDQYLRWEAGTEAFNIEVLMTVRLLKKYVPPPSPAELEEARQRLARREMPVAKKIKIIERMAFFPKIRKFRKSHEARQSQIIMRNLRKREKRGKRRKH